MSVEMTLGEIAYYAWCAKKGDAAMIWARVDQEPWEAAARAAVIAASDSPSVDRHCDASPRLNLMQRDCCVRVPEVCDVQTPAKTSMLPRGNEEPGRGSS